MLMNKLRTQNPNAYNQFQSYMNSGKSPEQVLNELIQNGTFNRQQVDQARQMAQQYTNTPNINMHKKF